MNLKDLYNMNSNYIKNLLDINDIQFLRENRLNSNYRLNRYNVSLIFHKTGQLNKNIIFDSSTDYKKIYLLSDQELSEQYQKLGYKINKDIDRFQIITLLYETNPILRELISYNYSYIFINRKILIQEAINQGNENALIYIIDVLLSDRRYNDLYLDIDEEMFIESLNIASQKGYLNIIKHIIENIFKFNLSNEDILDMFDHAVNGCHLKIIRYLVNKYDTYIDEEHLRITYDKAKNRCDQKLLNFIKDIILVLKQEREYEERRKKVKKKK